MMIFKPDFKSNGKPFFRRGIRSFTFYEDYSGCLIWRDWNLKVNRRMGRFYSLGR